MAVIFELRVNRLVLVVAVEVEDLVVKVLDNHALHNFQASEHAFAIKRIFLVHLDDLSDLLVLVLGLLTLFLLTAALILVSLHIRVEDHPLGHFALKLGHLRRVGLLALLTEGKVGGLGGAFLEVELISQRNCDLLSCHKVKV